jgi:cellulose biosynthesis protein BcsQ
MALIAFTAGKGSPGCTTTALALALTWRSRVVLAECDPAGGSARAGFLRGQLANDRGLVPLAVAELRGERLAVDFWRHLVDLDPPHQQRLLLAGIADPAQAGSLEPVWGRLAMFLSSLEPRHGYDVLADCGRLATGHPPSAVLCAADAVLVPVRPVLPSLSSAAATVRALRGVLADYGNGTETLGLCVIGKGPYTAGEISRQLYAPVIAELPEDARAAAALTFGGPVRRSWPLLRAIARSEDRIRAMVAYGRLPRSLAALEVTRGN